MIVRLVNSTSLDSAAFAGVKIPAMLNWDSFKALQSSDDHHCRTTLWSHNFVLCERRYSSAAILPFDQAMQPGTSEHFQSRDLESVAFMIQIVHVCR